MAVGWRPTGLMVVAGPAVGCSLATYGSYGGCWAGSRAVMVIVGPAVRL